MQSSETLLTVVIPAYNEAQSLPKLLEDLLSLAKIKNWKIIVVNDGSTDGTYNLLSNLKQDGMFKVIHHKANRGYGAAIKTGIKNVDTKYFITIDADGQHDISDIENMFAIIFAKDADMVIGNRKGSQASGLYRELGKSIIRSVAKIMMPIKVYDINSGIKIIDSNLAKSYINLCPDSFAFSDILTLIFVYQRNLVLEIPVKANKRISGKSTLGINTAFDTIMEIINIVMLFNPMRIFLPLSIVSILLALIWEIPIYLNGSGISTGALLGFITGLLFFLLGLLAEQLGNIRKTNIIN